MEQKIKPMYLFVISFFLLAGFASMAAIAKNDNDKNGSDKSNKEEKTSQSEEAKGDKVINLKDYKKADVTKGETNAKVHKEKTTEVIENLEKIQVQKEIVEAEDATRVEVKNKAKKQIAEVMVEQESSQEEVSTAIEEVENNGNLRKFIFGPDYKNLGQLRSELVQNRNQIRKLTQAIETLKINGEDTASLELQLQTLTQERERIKNIITTNQDGFSLFGWVSRFLNNYEKSPVDEKEEEELENEVETVLGETGDSQENTGSTEGTTDADTANVPVDTAANSNVDVVVDNADTDTSISSDDKEVLQ